MSRKTKAVKKKMEGAKEKKITQLDRIESLVTRQRENTSIDSAQLDRIEGKVDKQDESINGNGHEGLKTRTARIEENLESMALSIKGASDCAKDNAENLKKLTDLVAEHVKSVHLNNLLQKRWFWGLLVFGIVILNTASTYLPNLLNAFFTWAGIPFQLPLT